MSFMEYDDEKSYRFQENDEPGRCFTCGGCGTRLLVVRNIASMMLVHLCAECLLANLSDYFLDNTRPWIGGRD